MKKTVNISVNFAIGLPQKMQQECQITLLKNVGSVQKKFDKFILTLQTNKKTKCYLQ